MKLSPYLFAGALLAAAPPAFALFGAPPEAALNSEQLKAAPWLVCRFEKDSSSTSAWDEKAKAFTALAKDAPDPLVVLFDDGKRHAALFEIEQNPDDAAAKPKLEEIAAHTDVTSFDTPHYSVLVHMAIADFQGFVTVAISPHRIDGGPFTAVMQSVSLVGLDRSVMPPVATQAFAGCVPSADAVLQAEIEQKRAEWLAGSAKP